MWSVDYFLNGILPSMLDKLRKVNHGWPGEPMTFEEFNGDGGIIDQIAEGFRAAKKINDMEYEGQEEMIALEIAFDHGMNLFKQYYFDLWD